MTRNQTLLAQPHMAIIMNTIRSLALISLSVLTLVFVAGCDKAEKPAAEKQTATTKPAAQAAAAPTVSLPPAPNVQPLVLPEITDAKEGQEYEIIKQPEILNFEPGKVEVVEVFSYGCPHCRDFYPVLRSWKKGLPTDVQVKYVPMSEGGFEPLARAYYALDAMGIADNVNSQIFEHVLKGINNRSFNGKEAQILDMMNDLGVSKDDLQGTMKSFAIDAKINRARDVVTKWQISSTPSIVVGGKYRIHSLRDRNRTLQVAQWAVNQIRQERANTQTEAQPEAPAQH